MVEDFEQHRPLMFAIAYRMLGSAMEAEDIVQEAYLRYQAAPADSIRALKPFLTTIVTRLCLDQLKSARVQRETYYGPWLPEPVLTAQDDGGLAALNDSLSMAFLVLLEQLNPVERAVFLLREVFDYDYSEIAEMVGRSESACRQALHRARQHVHTEKPRFDSTPEQHRAIFDQFWEACSVGDLDGLVSLLAEDVTAWSDGGGKASAATRPLVGRQRVIAFVLGLMKQSPEGVRYEVAQINGGPGLIVRQHDTIAVILTLDVAQDKITGLRFIRNPDKLRLVRLS
jgi:RNA polymerase sigma-70 factor, ECF subfamily